MGIRIRSSDGILEGNLSKAQQEVENSLTKLSSGIRFTRSEPNPADRARADGMTSKIRELNSYKQSTNDGLSFVEYVDSGLSLQNNTLIRMRELATQSLNSTLSDRERSFLFVEYQSLYKEMERNALSATYANVPVLNGHEGSTDSLGFRVGSPMASKDNPDEDANLVTIDNLSSIQARPQSLGLAPAEDLINYEDGVSLEDVYDNFNVDDANELMSTFDKAQEKLSTYRAQLGAAGSRLSHALASLDIAQENLSATRSRIQDVDYAQETSNLVRANILVQAGTSLLGQKQLQSAQTALTLIKNLDK